MSVTIYHNGRCTKSRGALEILQEEGIPHEVRFYLAEPLSRKELKDLLKKLKMHPHELIRTKEQLYKENYEGKDLTDEQWLDVLMEHPILMERPIVVNGKKAVVARPPEKLHDII